MSEDFKKEVLPEVNIGYFADQDKLFNLFFTSNYNKELGREEIMALDLYRAINCYRYYKEDLDTFFFDHPEALNQKKDVITLWMEFDKLDANELAEIAIKAIQDI